MPCISEKVNNARNLIEDFLRQNNYLDDNSVSFSEKGVLLSGYRPLTHHQTFLLLFFQ